MKKKDWEKKGSFGGAEESLFQSQKTSSQRLFSLIEMLVVIAILAILISLLSPSLKSALYSSSHLLCKTHQREISLALLLYCDDNSDYYPTRDVTGKNPYTYMTWDLDLRDLMDPYPNIMDKSTSGPTDEGRGPLDPGDQDPTSYRYRGFSP